MTSLAQVGNDRPGVVRHSVLRDGQLIAVVLHQEPVRDPMGAWQPRAARIERPDTVDDPVGGAVGVAADDDVGAAPAEQVPELLFARARGDPRAVVCSRRRVHAEYGGPSGEPEAQLGGEIVQDTEQAGLVQHAAGPADVRGHGRVPFDQVDALGRVGDGRVRRRLVARQDIPVGVAAQHLNARQLPQQLEYLDGPRSEKDEVPQHPPAINPEGDRVRQYRAQRLVIAVDVGDNSELHKSTLGPRWPGSAYAFPVQLAYDDEGSGECVVLIHGHPFDRTLWEPQLAALRGSFRVLAPDLRGFGGMGVLVDYMHTGLYGPACPRAVRARVDAMMSAAPPAGAAAALRGRGRRPDYRPMLAVLDIPALVVAGTADPWSNAEVTAEIVASLRRPELVLIDGCGHLPNLEAEAQFNEALLDFLNRHLP
jgi:hypothetical protein